MEKEYNFIYKIKKERVKWKMDERKWNEKCTIKDTWSMTYILISICKIGNFLIFGRNFLKIKIG